METATVRPFKKMMHSSIHASHLQKALAHKWWYGFKYRQKPVSFHENEEIGRYYKLQKPSDKPDDLSFFHSIFEF
jgi:hypothetical protein